MRKINVKIKVGRDSLAKEYMVSAYMTPVAGLVVHPDVEYDTHDDRFILKRNSWAITQYPTGRMAFGNIFTRKEAFDIVNKEMAGFNWVGLTPEEAMAVNDAKELQMLARRVNEEIAKSRKLQLGARSK